MNDLKQLLFFDLETSGLKAKKHCILQFGCLVADPISLEVVQSYVVKILPRAGAEMTPKALEVNGYTLERWKDAQTWQQVVRDIYQLMKGRTLAGHNVIEFDWLFMVELFSMANSQMVLLDRDWNHLIDGAVDTLAMAKKRDIPGMVAGSNSLWNLCLMLGVVKPSDVRGNHDALADCHLSLGVYREMMKRYGQAIR